MIEVAYGLPERSTSEAQLLEVLGLVTRNFDEHPTRMHAVLGPAGLGVRWLTFATTPFRKDHVPVEDHFSETMETLVPELVVVARSRWGEDPTRFRLRGSAGRRLLLTVDGEAIVVGHGMLAEGVRRDGDVDEVGLGAAGLPITRAFDVLAAPTHEVVLRDERAIPATLAIRPLEGPILPVRVQAAHVWTPPDAPRFPRTPRAVDTADASALAAWLDSLVAEVESMWVQALERDEGRIEADVAARGDAIVPLLVHLLERPKPKPRTSRIALGALGRLGARPDLVFAWTTRAPSLAEAARAALARMGERARPVLDAHRATKKAAERATVEATLALLDDARFAPLRAAREGAAQLQRARDRAISLEGLLHPMAALGESAAWAVGLFLVENPLPMISPRHAVLAPAAQVFGAHLAPVALALRTLPSFADDPMLRAIAAGRPLPSIADLVAASKKKRKAGRRG